MDIYLRYPRRTEGVLIAALVAVLGQGNVWDIDLNGEDGPHRLMLPLDKQQVAIDAVMAIGGTIELVD